MMAFACLKTEGFVITVLVDVSELVTYFRNLHRFGDYIIRASSFLSDNKDKIARSKPLKVFGWFVHALILLRGDAYSPIDLRYPKSETHQHSCFDAVLCQDYSLSMR